MTVVLLLLAVTLLAHGSVVLAMAFRQGAHEAWMAVQVRRAVVGRVDLAARVGDTVPSHAVATGVGVETSMRTRRLSAELTLLEGFGSGGTARWWAGRVVWRPDPDARGQAMAASARLGAGVGTGGGGTVVASPGGSCSADLGPPAIAGLDAMGLHVGPLTLDSLEARFAPWAPTVAGASCPPGGCAPVAGVAAGPLSITEGTYTGVFLVRGDLTLSGTAVIQGLLLVEGNITLLDAARVDGALEATGHLVLGGHGDVVGDPCLVATVWRRGVGDLVGPVPLDRRAWALWGPPP